MIGRSVNPSSHSAKDRVRLEGDGDEGTHRDLADASPMSRTKKEELLFVAECTSDEGKPPRSVYVYKSGSAFILRSAVIISFIRADAPRTTSGERSPSSTTLRPRVSNTRGNWISRHVSEETLAWLIIVAFIGLVAAEVYYFGAPRE